MGPRTPFSAVVLGLAVAWSASALAQPVHGGWYAVEGNAGTIVELTAGGDLSQAPKLATGLDRPQDMCFGGPGHHLYVAATGLNAVYEITTGGDMSSVLPHAFQFPGVTTWAGGVTAIDCTEQRVLAGVAQTGAVFDVTTGGDMQNATPIAEGLTAGELVDLFTDSHGKVWASVQMTGVFEITGGGDFTAVSPTFAYDLGGAYGLSQLAELNGTLLLAHISPGDILDLSTLQPGALLSSAPLFATGINILWALGSSGQRLYAQDLCPGWTCFHGTFTDATGGGDLSGLTPHAFNADLAGNAPEALAYIHYCGDGIVWPNSSEECDEAGETGTCNADCTTSSCGDGVINTAAGEVCDDGTENSDTAGDACRTDCALPYCGDGVVDTGAGEACDDGQNNSNAEPDACRSDCRLAHCGDGIVDGGESCDDGSANSDTDADACRTNCALATCGDATLDDGEACDDGGGNSDTEPEACRTTCVVARCGDGVRDWGEACDDGNQTNDDGCGVDCTVEGPYAGTGGATACPVCNGQVNGGCSLTGAPSGGRSGRLWGLALLAFAAFHRRKPRAEVARRGSPDAKVEG